MQLKRPGKKLQVLIDHLSSEVDPRSATIFTKILNKGGHTEAVSDTDFAARCNLRIENFLAARKILNDAGLIEFKRRLGGEIGSHRLTTKGTAIVHKFDLQDRLLPDVPSVRPSVVPSGFVKIAVVQATRASQQMAANA